MRCESPLLLCEVYRLRHFPKDLGNRGLQLLDSDTWSESWWICTNISEKRSGAVSSAQNEIEHSYACLGTNEAWMQAWPEANIHASENSEELDRPRRTSHFVELWMNIKHNTVYAGQLWSISPVRTSRKFMSPAAETTCAGLRTYIF